MKKFTLLLALLSITIVVSAKKIYLDPWQWSSDDAKFTAWGWKDDSEGSMYTMNYDEAAQLYVVELSDEINNIIFLRKSPDHDLTNWDCWNKTIDLAIPSDKNKFTINNWNVQDDKSGGEWSTFENNTGNNDKPNNPATNITNGTNLYLLPSVEWKEANARFAAYFFGGDGELWLDMLDSNGDGIYEVVAQDTREKVIFCRMNPETTENNWDNKWNQTSDLTYDGTNNQYNVSGWDSGEWSVFSGNNGDNDNPEKPQPESSVYTLCGDSIIFGTNWDETNTNNDMTKGSDGIWIKEYTEITLTKGSYEYKVVADHNWDTAGKYPSDDSNMTLYIAKDGVYDLKFTFDPTIPELKAFATNKVNVENVMINNIYAINGFIYAETDITIYTVTGQDVTSQNGNLQNGVYIIKAQNKTSKLIINN